MNDSLRFDVAAATDLGRHRNVNADQYLIGEIHRVLDVIASSLPAQAPQRLEAGPAGHLLVVADGVGGAAGAEAASALAIETFVGYVASAMQLARSDISLEEDLLSEFGAAIASAHARVRAEGRARPELHDMASTLTLAYVLGARVYIAHVGDSRCYLIREGRALRLTTDQTVGQALLDNGVLAPAELERSGLRHVLASAVGGGDGDDPTVLTYQALLRGDDGLVLCTDGLTKHVGEDLIAHTVSTAASAAAATRELIAAALDAGGTDNVTVVVARLQAAV